MRMGGTASSLRVGVRHHLVGVLSRRQDEKAWSRAADGLNLSGASLEILDCGMGLPPPHSGTLRSLPNVVGGGARRQRVGVGSRALPKIRAETRGDALSRLPLTARSRSERWTTERSLFSQEQEVAGVDRRSVAEGDDL